MRIVIDFVYLSAFLAISPMVLYRMVRYHRYRTGWKQRFGKIARKNPEKKCIWIHAVSVGEVNAAKTIVKELENRFPDFEIVISTTTDTGFARATAIFSSEHTVFFFPLDFSWIMRRAFNNIQPTICMLMELEVWPNFIRTAHQSGIPVVILNGRISERSFSRYKKIKPVARKIFQKLSLILAQTDLYAQRFKEIGAASEKVIVTGSLKYDTAQIADRVEGADVLASQLAIGSEKLWVAGGTGNNEEEILLDVYQSLKQQSHFNKLRLVIVPRKPERFNEVAELIKQRGLYLVRYSNIKNNSIAPKGDNESVILGDTMGDLRKFYSLATVIFVGRSLVPMGGSDMMEAAALGKCTMFGPYASNFQQTVETLTEGRGAIMVKDKQELLEMMQKCLFEPDFAGKIAQNGREIIKKNQGATAKSINAIAKLLDNLP